MNINFMPHFVQKEEDESRLKWCLHTFPVVEQQWPRRRSLATRGPDTPPLGQPFSGRVLISPEADNLGV